jgi:signal transduction histidine kinase
MFRRGVIGCLLCSLVYSAAMADQPSPRSMLILDQSAPLRPWSTAIIKALRSATSGYRRGPLSYYVEHLDIFGFYSPQYEDNLRVHFRDKYRGKPIDVIVSIGPSALDFAVNLRATLWPTVPVIFAAVEELGAPHQLPPKTTGIVYHRTLATMVNAARPIVPNLKKLVVVGDPISYETYDRHLVDEVAQLTTDFEIIELLGLPVKELKQRVASLPADSIILYLGINADGQTRFDSAVEVLPIIAEVANRPIIVDAETALGTGAAGGFVRTPDKIGRDVAHLAMRILDGEDASATPVTVGNPLKPIFDWRQLQRWNISESSLPVGSELRFREPNIWERYWRHIMAAFAVLLVQAALIAWLIYEHRRRNRAEILAHNITSELSHMNRIATASTLSASIAHEVKQPLAAISANGSAGLRWLAKTTPDLGEARAAFERIVDAAHRAGNVIDTVRSMFKKTDDAKIALNPSRLITEVLDVLRINLERRRILVETRLSVGLPEIMGNRVQLQQVILNLVANAVDAIGSTTDGNHLLAITANRQEPADVLITVEDSGPGIAPENIRRIFEPFYTTKPQGMGMGLTICRSIVESHGGCLFAACSPLGGLAMHISLPASANGRALLFDADAAA